MVSTAGTQGSRPRTLVTPMAVFRRALPFVAIAVLPVALMLPALAEPMARDEGVYFTVAMFDGLPYTTVFDHKPPLVYGWYKLALVISGGDASVEVVRVVAALHLSATALIVAWIGNMVGGRRLALASGVAMAVVVSNQYLQIDANTEAFMLPWVALSLGAMIMSVESSSRRWAFVSGAAIGVAMMTKSVAIANLALAAFALVWAAWSGVVEWRRCVEMIATALAGCALVVCMILSPWIVSGHLGEFWYANVTYNARYGDLPLVERLFSLTRVDNRVLTASLWFWVLGMAGVFSLLKRVGVREGLLLGALTGSLLGATLPGRAYPHYLIAAIPFAAIAAGIGALRILDSPTLKSRQLAGLVVALSMAASIPALGNVYLSSPETAHVIKYGNSAHAARAMHAEQVARAVRGASNEGDRVFEIGLDTQIFVLAHRQPATYFNRPIAAFAVEPSAYARTMRELYARPPDLIVDTARSEYVVYSRSHATATENVIDLASRYRAPIDAFIAERYDYIGAVEFAKIYRLKR
jgi:hypothetical protein